MRFSRWCVGGSVAGEEVQQALGDAQERQDDQAFAEDGEDQDGDQQFEGGA